MSDIIESVSGPVTTLTLDRPDRRNAMSAALMSELTERLRDLDGDCQVVVLAGNGPAFSAGHDLGEMIDRPRDFYDDLFARCVELMETVHEIPQPVIARVHGVATAAGCQLVAACDLAVASDQATFATPGVRIGLFCSTPMVPISRAVGRKRAMEMLLTGRPIDAATAADWGLVNRVVPHDDLDDEIDSLISDITSFSRTVIGIGKEAFYRQIDLDEPGAYEHTRHVMAANAAADQAQEGMSAFLGKRRPEWTS